MKRVLLALCLAVLTILMSNSVMAATDWNFGASLRFATFWTEQHAGKGTIKDLEGSGQTLKSDGLLTWGQQSNSRIKMNMRSDQLEGYIEMGYNTNDGAVTTRYYWGKYKFSDIYAITIGQADQLFNSDKISSQAWDADWAMVGIGTSKRSGTSKIIFTAGGFNFALSQPEAKDKLLSGVLYNRNTYIPQLQASYQYKADTWRIKLAGGFQTYQLKDIGKGTANAISNKNVNSWLIGLDGDINFGPLYLAGAAAAGQNWSDANWNLGIKNYAATKAMSNMGARIGTGNNVKSTTSVMLGLVAGYRLTESLRFEAGAGYRYDENDTWKTDSNMWNVYLQAAYTVADGFRIIPEVGYIDLGKTFGSKNTNTKGIDAGYIWYAGAKWQMDF